MKESNEIDQLFKEGLQQDFPVNEALWQDVANQLPVQEHQKGFWIYLNSFTILAILGISLLLRSDSAISQEENNQIRGQQEVLFSMTSKSSFIKGESQTINSKREPSLNKQTNQTSLIEKTNKADAKPNLSSKTERIEQLTNNQEIKNEKRLIVEANDKNSFLSISSSNTPLKSVEIVSDKLGIEKEDFKSLDYIPSLNYRINNSLTSAEAQLASDTKLNKMQQKLKPHLFEYEIDYYQSFTQNKNLSDLESSIKTYREASEKSLQIEQYGFHVFRKYQFLHFGIGVQHSKYQEQVHYNVTELENVISIQFDTSYQIINGNYSSNGVPVVLIKENINRTETTVNVEKERNLVFRNEISRIQLPISIGFRQNWGRLQAGLRSSFVINYLSSKQGAYISNDQSSLIAFEDQNQLNEFVYSNQHQISLGYALNEFFLIGGRYSYNYDLNSFTNSYSSKLEHHGLGLWLRFQPK
tara:strand:- start:8199 stop:9608 length:1410 start_codon:yes stop_codon:yes gene_type:complete